MITLDTVEQETPANFAICFKVIAMNILPLLTETASRTHDYFRDSVLPIHGLKRAKNGHFITCSQDDSVFSTENGKKRGIKLKGRKIKEKFAGIFLETRQSPCEKYG